MGDEVLGAEEVAEGEPDEAAGDGAPKRRSRRGSRGGRRRKKKPAETAGAAEGETGEAVPVDEVSEDELDAAGPAADADGRQAGPPQRRRQRSSPRIHVPAADLDDRAAEDETAPDAAVTNGVPEEGAPAEDGQTTARKRTRRGSRGGRNRRRKPAGEETAPADATADAPAADAEQEPVLETVASPDEGGYVPMAEWLEDFDG